MDVAGDRSKLLEMVIAILLLIAVNWLSYTNQKPVSQENGSGWDGAAYCNIAQQIAWSGFPVGAAGHHAYRIGTSTLVGLWMRATGMDVLPSFKIVNTVGANLAALLMLIWLRCYVGDVSIRLLLFFLFVTQWHAAIRYAYWYPTQIEPWYWVFWIAGFIGLYRVHKDLRFGVILLCISVFCATVVRETGLALVAGAAAMVATRRGRIAFVSSAVCGVGAFILTRMVANSSAAGGMDYIVNWFFGWRWSQVHSDIFVVVWFVAFGPIIVLLVPWVRSLVRFLWSEKYMLFLLIVLCVHAYTGPTDERFIYWSAPIVYVVLGRALMDYRLLKNGAFEVIAALAIAQSVSQRWWWTIPDAPPIGERPAFFWLTPWGSTGPFEDLQAWLGTNNVPHTMLNQYTTVALVLLALLGAHFLRLRLTTPRAG